MAQCLARLRSRGQTLSTAESLTSGLLASTLAAVPGASDVLRGGIAAYASDVKVSVLGVEADLVARHGAVSLECAEAMAERACALFESGWAVATTGVAGPDPQEGHRPGEVYVAVAGPGVLRSEQLGLKGTRRQIRQGATEAVLRLLQECIDST